MKEQTEVGKLKEGRYVVVDDEPCKIMSIYTNYLYSRRKSTIIFFKNNKLITSINK